MKLIYSISTSLAGVAWAIIVSRMARRRLQRAGTWKRLADLQLKHLLSAERIK
jgi:hypothetical protein